jgi:hypothetical protein
VSRRSLLHLSAGPVLAALGFLALSKASVGSWFVSSGFFVVDNAAHGKFLVALAQTCRGLLSVSDAAVLLAAMAGLAWCLRMAVRERSSRALLPVALLATALVPLAAFHAGHPFRVRYVVQLTVAAAVLAAFALSWLPARLRGPAAAALISVSFWLNPPFVASSPIVNEAQVDGPLARERASVSAVLAARTDRSPIMASMQSLAHYMQETSRIGLNVADYLHEGNGDLWTAALAEPRRYVRWMLIEERAEGGDLLAERARTHPGFLDGFARVAGGGGLVLYRRDDSR